MNKRNYQKEMDGMIEQLTEEGRVPTLLLHSCCAPCSSYVLEYLTEYFEITDFFYNPNIFPPEEYELRLKEMERLAGRTMQFKHPVKMLAGSYDPQVFFEMAKGMEQIPEGQERCFRCYRLRLEEAAKAAKEQGTDYFATTLTLSPLKNAEKINAIGEELAEKYGVAYLSSDFKKKNGYLRSIELSKEYDLYRQDYCGCIFSRKEAEERRRKREEGTTEKAEEGSAES
ncbi:MAG: epoxyqueuosine reductase QueH [Lachnospiraceae bacterium]|nr:epoxyqueuosine reductase QueH [Lachnospiraceae bacterium]